MKGYQAKVFGFVVGALGSWYHGNDKVLDELQVSMRNRTLFRNSVALMQFNLSGDPQ